MRLLSFLCCLSCPLLTVCVHALLARLLPKAPAQKLALLAAVAQGSLCLFLVTLLEADALESESFFFALFLVAGLGHIYFHLFNMSETARRIRLLVDLKEGQSPEPYDAESALAVRLKRLVALKQIRFDGARFISNRTWLTLVASVLVWHERLLFPKRST